MAVFFDSVGTGAVFDESVISFPIPIDLFWTHQAPPGRQTAVVAAMSFWVYNTALTDLTRKVWYGSQEMTSLGVKEWTTGAGAGWTELFGILNPPKGRQIVHGWVLGGLPFIGKLARGNSVSYTGVDSFGTVTNAAGVGTGTLSLTGTGASATKVVTAFGTKTVGLAAFNQTQRYLSNTSCSLLLGDADGTGSSTTFSVTRGRSGPWSAQGVVLNAADIVATATGVSATPVLRSAGKRLARPGVTRRTIFAAEPEN